MESMIYNSIQFVIFLFELMILFKFLKGILQLRNYKYSKIGLIITSIICYFITFLHLDSLWTPLITYLVAFIYVCIFFEGGIFNKIISIGIFMMINIAIENIIAFIFIFGFDIQIAQISNGPESDTFMRLSAIIFSKIILFYFISIYINRRNRKKNMFHIKINQKLLLGITTLFLLIIFITSVVLNLYLQINQMPSSVLNTIYLLVLGFAGLCILCIILYELILKESEKQMKLKLQLQKRESEYKYNQEIALTVDNIRGVKHDMNNHLAVISGYIQTDNCRKAKEYIEKLSQPMETNTLLDINHHAISSILYVKTILAQKNNIPIRTNIDILQDVYIDEMDMTIILGNILDNAIEATKELYDKEKNIEITVKTIENNLIVDCTNAIEPHKISLKDNKLFTTKKDFQNHGIGLKNVERVVNQYDGHMSIEINENQFTINITLQNKPL